MPLLVVHLYDNTKSHKSSIITTNDSETVEYGRPSTKEREINMTMRQSGRFSFSALAGLMAVALMCTHAFTVSAQDYCVATNGNDSWAGTSWAAPFLTIQKGIDSATAGQTVAVSNGTYVLTTQLLLNKGITLQGFGGASNTVIDANLTGRVLAITDSAAVMDGFTLKNGKSATALNGTGVSMTGGTLRNCTVSTCTNTATSGTIQGVGIYMTGGTVDTCNVTMNYCARGIPINGGGIYMVGSSCLVTNCLIANNSIGFGQQYPSSRGGGVFCSGGMLFSSVVTNNYVQQGRNNGGGGGVYVTGAGIASNCTIAANFADSVDCYNTGGGVYVDWGTVVDCVVSNNHTAGFQVTYGGGVFMTGTSRVERCTITGNYQGNYYGSCTKYGAGLCMTGVSNCLATNCVIVSNSARAGGYNKGAGAYVSGGLLADSKIVNNSMDADRAPGNGGGMFVTAAGVVSKCTITGNDVHCTDTQVYGGGVYASGGNVANCVISNNYLSAYFDGEYGAGVYMTATALVERCVITRNYTTRGWNAIQRGGGVYSDGGIMRSCLIAGNYAAYYGGGLYITAGTNENCTIVRNLCAGNGANYNGDWSLGRYGGVYWTNSAVIINAIVYNNTGNLENDIQPVVGGVSGVTYSCAPSLTSGTGNVIADPLFVDSGIGSGTTFTAGDYRPVIGSPCEKTGLVAGWMSTALELAGLPRLSSGLVAMGAYAAIPPKSSYVSDSGNDLNTGTSWDAPFKTIQKGIDAASALGTVSVSNGTYVLTSQLLIGKGCTVMGLGGRSNTIINANASGRILTIDNASAVVDGFTLKNGKSATAINGTGVNMTGGTLRNCTISSCTNNTQTYSATPIQGVGIYMTGGTVDTCTIEKNMGGNIGMTVNGGGLYMAGSGGLVTNCLISDNYAGQEFATSKGGGAYLSAGKLLSSVIRNNTVNAGRSTGGGGGVFVTGVGMVSNCTISANAVPCVDALTRGGGVYIDGGTVSDCVVSNNTGTTGWSIAQPTVGGGVYMTSTALVERCVITRNYQTANGGMPRYGAGVASEGGTMRSCLIMGNTANTVGGGLYITTGTNENCTIVRNDCSGGNYGGVYWTNTPVIVNAIVYNNTSSYGESNILAVVGGVANVTYSCAPSLTSGTGNKTGDPQFTASGSGFGTTFTAGNYRLTGVSPCKNTGYTEVRMNTATDLDRLPRVKTFIVDMGAYERQVGSTGTMLRVF